MFKYINSMFQKPLRRFDKSIVSQWIAFKNFAHNRYKPIEDTETNTVGLVYNVTEGTEYFVSLYTSVVITEEYNGMVNSEELIGTA